MAKEGSMEGEKEGQTKLGYWPPKMVSESLKEEKIQIKIPSKFWSHNIKSQGEEAHMSSCPYVFSW